MSQFRNIFINESKTEEEFLQSLVDIATDNEKIDYI